MTSRKLTVFALAGIVLLTMMALTPTPVAAYTDTDSNVEVKPGQWLFWDQLIFSQTWTLTITASIGYSDPNFDEFLVTSAEYSNYENGYSFEDIDICSHQNIRSLSSSTCSVPAGSYVLLFDNTNAGLAKTNGYSDFFTYTVTGTTTSSGGAPTVYAYASKSSGSSPLLVSFSSTASGGTSPYTYEWDFGDGSIKSTVQNPTHTYTKSGTHYAYVTVKDYYLQTVTSTEIMISVTGSPSVDPGGVSMLLFVMCILPIVIVIIVIILVIYFVMRRKSAPPAYQQPPMGQPYQQGPPQQPYYSPPPPPPMDPYQQPPPPPPPPYGGGGGGGGYQSPPPPPYGSGSTYQSPPPPPYR